MKLHDLKTEVFASWELLNLVDGTPTVESLFKTEIRKFGDLRRKGTWKKAAVTLEARSILKGMDNRDIIHYFCKPDTLLGKAYNQEILDEVLTDQEALEQLRDGLERLYATPFSSKDQEYAIAFLKRISSYQDVTEALQSIALSSAA
jgi:hypothetical protein